jgi:exopolyphosphatase/guanosine-5'-triphosphate,3'-diphosphate pyrophosphatase
LAALVKRLGSSQLIVSSHGLREGLLYQDLPVAERAQDPLLAAAEAEGEAQGRFPGHGTLIDAWIAPLFTDDSAEMHRIRQAACLLGDVGWRANPDFRAERGVEIALHGNWVGIDVVGRAMLAQALYSSFGGGAVVGPDLTGLADTMLLHRAMQWGLAIRLAQRLSGGVARPLQVGHLSREAKSLVLHLPGAYSSLYGEAVQRRLRQLGQAMSLEYRFSASD